MIIARYMMFTQVYFQHARRAYDHHATLALQKCLAEAQAHSNLDAIDQFPPPDTVSHLEEYLRWDDWRVAGFLAEGRGGEHGEILRNRRHHRHVYQTTEVPRTEELEEFEHICDMLGDMVSFTDDAVSSWYKIEDEDILIERQTGSREGEAEPLSSLSSVIRALRPIRQRRIYVPLERRKEAKQLMKGRVPQKEGATR